MNLNYKPTVGIRFVAKVFIEDKTLRVEFGFWERIGGFTSNKGYPINQVLSCKGYKVLDPRIIGIRTLGTGLPFVIALGHFRKSGRKILVAWRKGQQAIEVELVGDKPKLLVLGCEDALKLEKELSSYLPV